MSVQPEHEPSPRPVTIDPAAFGNTLSAATDCSERPLKNAPYGIFVGAASCVSTGSASPTSSARQTRFRPAAFAR